MYIKWKRNFESIAILFILIIIITPVVDNFDISQFYRLNDMHTVIAVILAGSVYIYLQKNSSEWDMIDNLASAIFLFVSVEQLLQWQVFQYNQILWPSIWIVMPISILIRMIIKETKQNKNSSVANNKNETIIELHDILGKTPEQDSKKLSKLKKRFENQADENGKLPLISFRENMKDVDDQLNRKAFVNDIVQALKGVHSNSDDSFAIALTGKWGSGKTTVIESVKAEIKTEKIIIIDDISFWEYENKQALLKAIIERILQEADVLNIFERQIFTQLVLETIGEKLGIKLQSFLNSTWDLKKYKARIGTALVKKQKRIIFLIDDLERTNSAIAVMIFKVIATMLNIRNVVYLFCYDEEEMQGHFQAENINFDYVDKIINQKFTLPKISEKTMDDLTRRILQQLAAFYGREEIISITSEIVLPVENIRDLKRMFNSLMPYIQKNELGLNERDRLLINYIKFKDNELWYQLFEHGNYLTNFYYIDSRKAEKKRESDRREIVLQTNQTEYESERIAWIEKIKIDYSQYFEVLELLFDKFEKPKHEKILRRTKSNRQRNIVNGRFFYSYFTDEPTKFIGIINVCEKFFNSDVEKIKIVKKILEDYFDDQDELFNYLAEQTEHFGQKNILFLEGVFSEFDNLNFEEYKGEISRYCVDVIIKFGMSDHVLNDIEKSIKSFYFHNQNINYLHSKKVSNSCYIIRYDKKIKKMFIQVWENESITEQNLESMIKIYLQQSYFYGEKTQFEWQTWFQSRITENNCLVFLERLYYSAFDADGKFDFEKYAKVLQKLGISNQLAQLDIDAMKNNYSTKEIEDISRLTAINRYQDFIKQQEKGLSS